MYLDFISRAGHTAVRLATLLAALALAGSAQAQLVPRPIDGVGAHPLRPAWGSAGSQLLRIAEHDYADGTQRAGGVGRPSARAVSNAVCAQSDSVIAARAITDFVWQWGQFVDHDIDLTEVALPGEALPIPVPSGDPWFDPQGTGERSIAFLRSEHTPWSPGVPREQINAITAYLDASMVYGSNAVRAAALRRLDGTGRLRTSAGELLPFNTQGLPNAPNRTRSYFLAGDVRANEQVGLTALHTLFVREHNGLCVLLQERYSGLGGQRTYELARAIVAAEIQHVTYAEWLPTLLGPEGSSALGVYTGWRSDVHPGIANEFSTAAFRFGHTMLSSELLRLDATGASIAAGPLPLRNAFFAPRELVATGIEPILRGLAAQRPQEVDLQVVDDVRNFLFGPPGAGGFDLAALNVQRGRDHGLSGYNRMRAGYGLEPRADFAGVCSDPRVVQELAGLYSSPDEMDAWVGCLAEDHLPDALVGELAATVMIDQFRRLRDGDFHWYQRTLPAAWLAWVEDQTLAVIVRRNTTIGSEVQDDVFRE